MQALTRYVAPFLAAGRRAADGRLFAFGIATAAWAVVVLACTIQGQLIAAYHGWRQDWWPTLGYTAAVFSIWGLLTPVVLAAADRVERAPIPRAARTVLALAGYPAAVALHVLLFVVVFWPVYGARMPSPLPMMRPVLVANVDTSVFAYAALIAAAAVRRRLRTHAKAGAPAARDSADDETLWVRNGGGAHLVRLDEIDWIAAAGDYAEIHAGGQTLLIERSLTALAEQLPAHAFARIHRGAIVRLDRVREVRRLGRGDAAILLHGGHALRLSRRYRDSVGGRLPV